LGDLSELFDSDRKGLRGAGNKLVCPCVEPLDGADAPRCAR